MSALTVVQIGRRQLGLDDATYRALLQQITGKTSATQCSEQQLQQVIEHMKSLGFIPKNKGGQRPRVARGRRAILSKIEAILTEANRPWAYAIGMAKKMFNRERLEWLDDDQLRKLMSALIYDQKRRKRNESGTG